jgi:hypothetical protein
MGKRVADLLVETLHIEQKPAGLVPVYTDLKNPDFGEVAKAVGLWGTASRRQASWRSPCRLGSRSPARRCCMSTPSSIALGGRLWVVPNSPRGARLQFGLPFVRELDADH